MPVLLRHALMVTLLVFCSSPACAATDAPLAFSGIDGDPTTLISLQVLNEAYQAIGKRFVLRLYPATEALNQANAGQADGTLHRIAGIERMFPDLVRVPVAINQTEPIAVVKRPDIHISEWHDLSNYRIGVPRGIILYEQRTAGMDVTRLEHTKQLLNMLDRGRLDVVVDDRLDVMLALRNPKFSDLHIGPMPLETIPVYHYLHKRHRDLLPQLTAALEKMQRSGRIQAIRDEIISRLQRGEPLPPPPVPVESGRPEERVH